MWEIIGVWIIIFLRYLFGNHAHMSVSLTLELPNTQYSRNSHKHAYTLDWGFSTNGSFHNQTTYNNDDFFKAIKNAWENHMATNDCMYGLFL